MHLVCRVFPNGGRKFNHGRDANGYHWAVLSNVLPMTAVLVDDNVLDLLLLEKFFEGMGVITYSTTQPTKAAELIVAHRPDLLVTDFDMPEMSGAQLAAQIRMLCHSTRIWCVTASVEKQDFAHIHSGTFDAVFWKPLQYRLLLTAVSQLTLG